MKKYSLQLCIFLGLVSFIIITGCFNGGKDAGTAKQIQQHGESKMSKISEAVLASNLSAVDIAKRQGVAAVPELSLFLEHPDNAVRTVAVTALGEIQHPDAYKALMHAAEEDDNTVSATAINQLSRHGSLIGIDTLIRLLSIMKSDAARGQLALTIGQLGSSQDMGSLESICAEKGGSETTLSCMAALARLGSEKSQKDFSRHLLEKRDLRAFMLAEYINQSWLLPHLGQLLRYTDPLLFLGEPEFGSPSTLRVCDKAVVLMAKIRGKPFSFSTDRHMNYDADQLAEAARAAGPVK